ncbi:hypothetical protein AZF37_07325 [endosymbiont 'TC1' of Trimyema compressum]|uniref:solute carrier family 23 protein n=1 Tax=endosymbiont 'TC1' of Trimyema compressum TaxID=243899 RepID=UPI0007F1588E|nr:solute carrier family 23 protein [endosymbiont 'TC1' of Trimyema compressum]AMP20997.1 hypothetical protein AZF37_07325 [endosymbiont 'TC1' of Trimyema compressum]
MAISPLSGHLLRLFPSVVTGTLITAVGISLIPVGLTMIGGQGVGVNLGGDSAYGSPMFF